MKLKTYRPIPTNPAKLFDNKVICTITTKITLMSVRTTLNWSVTHGIQFVAQHLSNSISLFERCSVSN